MGLGPVVGFFVDDHFSVLLGVNGEGRKTWELEADHG